MKVQLTHNVANMGTSATIAMKQKVSELRAQGREVFNFGLGESPFPVSNISAEALRANATRTNYLPTNGIVEVREAITKFYAKYFNYSFNADRVLIGPGSKELLYIGMVALDVDWLFTTPSWVSYISQAKLTNSRYHTIPLSYKDEYRLTEKTFRKRFNELEIEGQAATIINYPNNPTGLTLSNEEVRKIAKFARNNEIIVISDEIYANLTHPDYPDKHLSMALEYPEGTIVTGGLSKDRNSAGWRFGVSIIPEELAHVQKAYKTIGSETFSCVPGPIQYAAITACTPNDEIDKDIQDANTIHSLVGGVVHDMMKKGGYDVPRPEGAFYLMPSLNHMKDKLSENGIDTSAKLTATILDKYGSAAIPGLAFGLEEDNFAFRMAYIDYNGENVLNLFRDDPDTFKADPRGFVEEYCTPLYKGLIGFQNFTKDL